ncbi:MAG TPA: hypothetical protein VNA19_08510 [Pyrinomonadaceae bacterium]|nr:hypothetical protein [Pyrinomonadaceae bacterium]
MKYLIILGLLLAIGGFVYWRLRPYIRMIRHALDVVRGVGQLNIRRENNDAAAAPQRASNTPNEKMLRCSACGAWTPASRAVSLRSSNTAYCSPQCLERAADTPRRANKSA